MCVCVCVSVCLWLELCPDIPIDTYSIRAIKVWYLGYYLYL